MNRRGISTCVHLCTKLKKTKGRSVSSQIWLARHVNDPYVRQSQVLNYRCRSAFKLIEIDDKHKILHPGMTVVDCGAAPGSWTQVAVSRVNAAHAEPQRKQGMVIGVDLLHILPIDGAILLPNLDFTQPETQLKIFKYLSCNKVDVILSDMAPNASGVRSVDTENIVNLCLSVLKFSRGVLTTGGTMLCKLWQGAEQRELEERMKTAFEIVKVCKPHASRRESSEIFILGSGYKNHNNG